MQKLISYRYKGIRSWGILNPEENAVFPALDLEEAYFTSMTETLADFIETGEEGLLTLASLLRRNETDHAVNALPLDHIIVEIPLYPRRNIFCVGKNYRDHVREFERNHNAESPKIPVFFTKATTSVIGPGDTVIRHGDVTSQVDYEGELAVIIGKQGSDIPEEEAMHHVYGYTALNDITARDLQRSHEQWFKGKSLDTFCPIGPAVLVDREATDFTVTTKVNGEIRQQASTKDLIFSIPRLISVLSQGFTLLSGDIIATGTPSGVGMGFDPPRFLQRGDTVEVTVDRIGTLSNPVK